MTTWSFSNSWLTSVTTRRTYIGITRWVNSWYYKVQTSSVHKNCWCCFKRCFICGTSIHECLNIDSTCKLVILLSLTFRNASARKGDRSRTVWCSIFLWILGRNRSMCCEVCCTTWWQTLEWPCNGVLLYKVGCSLFPVLSYSWSSFVYLEFIVILFECLETSVQKFSYFMPSSRRLVH